MAKNKRLADDLEAGELSDEKLDTIADAELLAGEDDDDDDDLTVLDDDGYAPTEVSFASSYLTEVSDLTMASTGNNRYGAVHHVAGPLVRPRRRRDGKGNVQSRASRHHPLGHERVL